MIIIDSFIIIIIIKNQFEKFLNDIVNKMNNTIIYTVRTFVQLLSFSFYICLWEETRQWQQQLPNSIANNGIYPVRVECKSENVPDIEISKHQDEIQKWNVTGCKTL